MTDKSLQFFNPWSEVDQSKNRLPHWEQAGATFSVTFRVGDSLPVEVLSKWREEKSVWLALHPEPWSDEVEMEYHRRFSGAQERWLDRGYGACPFRRSDLGECVADVLMKFDRDRYFQRAWVVMPNHVHLLFSMGACETLSAILKSWKGVSSREIRKVLKGERDAFWAKDYFDRMIRDEAHFWNFARYVRRNPVRAGLSEGEYLLYESDHVREVLDAC